MPHFILLPGLNGDLRIFDRLAPRLPNSIIIGWIRPRQSESLVRYAVRIADSFAHSNDMVVVGVSFGGLVAQEVAVRLRARACVIISSIRCASEMPPRYRLMRCLTRFPLESMLAAASHAAVFWPNSIRLPSTARLASLSGEQGAWHRWSMVAALGWKPTPIEGVPLWHIHGDRDATFPIRYTRPDFVIEGGHHGVAYTHASQVAHSIMSFTNRLN